MRPDHVVIFEGPAGEPLPNEDECPETYLIGDNGDGFVHTRMGAWRTDAEKRTAMVEYCRRWRDQAPVWGVWIDGDEVLVNGEYLRDHLNVLDWQNDPAEPYLGWPMHLVELDGGVTLCRGKCVRIDLIDGYSVSSSVFRNALGIMHGEGNLPVRISEYQAKVAGAIRGLPLSQQALARDRLMLPPPLPCEPYLLHRSALRHPARRGLRMHEQEAVEIEKAQLEG